MLSWFPYMLATEGVSASESGLMFGLMQLVSVPAGMVLIAIGARPRMLRPAFYLASVATVLGVAGMLLLPAALAPLTAVLLGFGLGIFPLIMVMISRSGRNTTETTALSTLAQSVGLPAGDGRALRHGPAAQRHRQLDRCPWSCCWPWPWARSPWPTCSRSGPKKPRRRACSSRHVNRRHVPKARRRRHVRRKELRR